MKIEMKIRDKSLEGSKTRYSKSEMWWIKWIVTWDRKVWMNVERCR